MELDSAADVIDALGGVRAVADLTGSTYRAVHNWKQNGRFPAKTFLVLDAALLERKARARADLWRMMQS
jgi:hypothetical protein